MKCRLYSASVLELRWSRANCTCTVSEAGVYRLHFRLWPRPGESAKAAALGPSYAVPPGSFQPIPAFEHLTQTVNSTMQQTTRLCSVAGTTLSAPADTDIAKMVLRLSSAAGGVGAEAGFELGCEQGEQGLEFRLDLGRADRLYGLGERTGYLDKRGRSYLMWNTDEPFHHELRDPLYQAIPFVIHCPFPDLQPPQAAVPAALGLFLDDPGRSVFDLGEATPDQAVIRTERHEAVLYLVPGADMFEVSAKFSELTGRHAMPPRWALGFQQCRYSYYPHTRVRELAQEFRRRHIPCDVIYLDIHYMDGYRVFTWDPQRFPEPEKLIQELHDHGFRVVTIVDPGVKVDPEYDVYLGGTGRGVFAATADGTVYTGEVWPGPAVFPDFLREDTRSWWAEQHRVLFDAGVDGIWNDMNEPADFTGDFLNRTRFTPPAELMLDGSAGLRSIDRYHNVYGHMMCAACEEAFRTQKPGQRPFMVSRAGYAGIQRYAAVWTGDNDSTWAHLALMLPMLMNMGLSGVAFCGADVGGFQMNATGELYARWILSSCFTPFFRAHSALGTKDHEPWSFGPEVEEIARRAISLRGRLLPYIYSLFDEYRRTGRPLLRPMAAVDPANPRLAAIWNQFLLGADLLVAPVLEPEARSRVVYLPQGRWYRWDTHCFAKDWALDSSAVAPEALQLFEGGREHLVVAPLEQIPVFVRAGAVLPLYAHAPQHDADCAELDAEPLLLVFADSEEFSRQFLLYDDDRESEAYLDGKLRRELMRVSGPQPLQLQIATQDDGFPRRAESYRVVVFSPGEVRSYRIAAQDGVTELSG